MKSQAKTEILSLIEKFSDDPSQDLLSPQNIDQLRESARYVLLDRSLELSKARPFFWSLVEAYVDRFQVYPFDMARALFSYLELREYPEDEVKDLVTQLEARYLEQHRRPMKQATELVTQPSSLDDEIRDLRDSLKYAALVEDLKR